MPTTRVHLTNRPYLIAYVRNKWGKQPVMIQLTRELRGDSIFYENIYDISVIGKSTSPTNPQYLYLETITMNKTTYKQMTDRLLRDEDYLAWNMTVQEFLNGMVTRTDVIDEILAEL